MAQYRVTKKSFLNNSLLDEGTVVEYDGVASDNLEPLEGSAAEAKATAAAADRDAVARLKVSVAGADPNTADPSAGLV